MLRKWTLLVIAIALLIGATFGTASADDEWLPINDMLDAGTSGGLYGYMLKRVDGPTIFTLRSNGLLNGGAWYPASTVKVNHHLAALRWAQENGGVAALQQTIPVYGSSCSGSGTITETTLSSVLQSMMVNSNNQMTNAVQDFIGQGAINSMMQNDIGMSVYTQLNHKLGCGGPTNDPANQMTNEDITLLYEKYARGDMLNPAMMTQFEALMLNHTNTNFLNAIVSSEANKLGLSNAELTAFNNQFSFAVKAGNIPASVDGTLYESIAGLARVPVRTCDGIVVNQYVYSVFVDGADTISASLTNLTAREMMRGEIANALATFKPFPLYECVAQQGYLDPGNDPDPFPFPLGKTDGMLSVELNLSNWLGRTNWFIGATSSDVRGVPDGLQPVSDALWLIVLEDGSELRTDRFNATLTTDASLPERTELYYRGSTRADWVPADSSCSDGQTSAVAFAAPICATGEYVLLAPQTPTAVSLRGVSSDSNMRHTLPLLLMILTLPTVGIVRQRQ